MIFRPNAQMLRCQIRKTHALKTQARSHQIKSNKNSKMIVAERNQCQEYLKKTSPSNRRNTTMLSIQKFSLNNIISIGTSWRIERRKVICINPVVSRRWPLRNGLITAVSIQFRKTENCFTIAAIHKAIAPPHAALMSCSTSWGA